MINLHWLIGVALASAQVASPPEPAPPATTVDPLDKFNLGKKPGSELTGPQAETFLSKCSERRFETSAEGMIDGQMKRRRITLCAAPGDSDGQWTVKLENAVVWVRAQKGLSDPVKDKLVADLRDEIARVKTHRLSTALPSAALPAADALVATVPPMPPPLPRFSPPAASLIATPKLARPPLTIRCLGAGDRGAGGRCDRVDADTVFAVHADANLASPAILRFLRRGETRAEVPLAALRQGQTARVKLPSPVCSRVTGSVMTIQILARDPTTVLGNRVADEHGPFRLRC